MLAGGAILYVWIAAVLFAGEVKARKGHVRRAGAGL